MLYTMWIYVIWSEAPHVIVSTSGFRLQAALGSWVLLCEAVASCRMIEDEGLRNDSKVTMQAFRADMVRTSLPSSLEWCRVHGKRLLPVLLWGGKRGMTCNYALTASGTESKQTPCHDIGLQATSCGTSLANVMGRSGPACAREAGHHVWLVMCAVST